MVVGRRIALALALAAVGILGTAAVATAVHPRPKGATPIRVSLVPAYDQCTAPNRTHGPPLAFPSCHSPAQSSGHVTVGTPDANGAPAKSSSFIRYRAHHGIPGPPGDDANVMVTMEITDVRCTAAATTCGSANAGGGPDYTGELEAVATVRITDHFNNVSPGGGTNPATVTDFPARIKVTCASTADPSVGASCVISTEQQLFFPASLDDKRMVIEFGQISIRDGGPDGLVATDPQDNAEFMRQGVFIP